MTTERKFDKRIASVCVRSYLQRSCACLRVIAYATDVLKRLYAYRRSSLVQFAISVHWYGARRRWFEYRWTQNCLHKSSQKYLIQHYEKSEIEFRILSIKCYSNIWRARQKLNFVKYIQIHSDGPFIFLFLVVKPSI